MGKKAAPATNGSNGKESVDVNEKPAGTLKPLVCGFLLGVVACGVLLVALQHLDPVLLSTLVSPPAADSSCPACPSPAPCSCPEVPKLKSQLEEIRAKLDDKQAALVDCTQSLEQGVLREKLLKEKSQFVEEPAQRSEVVRLAWPEGAWPQCKSDVVLATSAGGPIREDLTALFGTVVTGCRMNDCTASDTFITPRSEDCAHACSALARCNFWTHGEELCTLLASDDVQGTQKPGHVSGPKACVPMPTKFSRAQAVLAVLDSERLRSCDAGEVSDSCPDLKDAMRTWLYALETFKMMAANVQHDFENYLEQIFADTSYFVGAQETNAEMYNIGASNNRQVLDALRQFITERKGSEEVGIISELDISLPNPVRGHLCRNSCPEVL